MIRLAALFGLACPVLVVAGICLWSVPAALIVSGVLSGAVAYGFAYAARRGDG